MTREEALSLAHRVLEGKPKSYVEAARLLAGYVVDLDLVVPEALQKFDQLAMEEIKE